MKYKLFTLLAASFTMVASGQVTKEKASQDADSTEAKTTVVAPTSVVGKSIAPVVQKFDGEKYAPTKLTSDADYYVLYFTASW